MKARIENNRIIVYGAFPSKYKSSRLNVAGGFHTMPSSVHESEGFFDVVIPDGYDEELQQFGEMFFDEVNKVFTYYLVDLEIDLASEKELRKAELKEVVEGEIIVALGVSALEHLIIDGAVPQENIDTVVALRAWEAQTIADIDAMTDVKLMKKYKIKRKDVENAKNLLKSGRKK